MFLVLLGSYAKRGFEMKLTADEKQGLFFWIDVVILSGVVVWAIGRMGGVW